MTIAVPGYSGGSVTELHRIPLPGCINQFVRFSYKSQMRFVNCNPLTNL
jgi:hypothetical protein